MKFHPEIHDIGFKHRYEINKALQPATEIEEILQTSIFVTNPNGDTLFFSTNPTAIYSIIEEGHEEFITRVMTSKASKHEFYTWEDSQKSDKLTTEHVLDSLDATWGYSGGFVLVRIFNEFQLQYTFATDPNMKIKKSNVINKLNHFLALGDELYNRLLPLTKQYCGK